MLIYVHKVKKLTRTPHNTKDTLINELDLCVAEFECCSDGCRGIQTADGILHHLQVELGRRHGYRCNRQQAGQYSEI